MYRLSDRFSVAQLAFKHRENENLRQRIIVVVASPLSFPLDFISLFRIDTHHLTTITKYFTTSTIGLEPDLLLSPACLLLAIRATEQTLVQCVHHHAIA